MTQGNKKASLVGGFFIAKDQNRTDDIRIFSPPLYQLSYFGKLFKQEYFTVFCFLCQVPCFQVTDLRLKNDGGKRDRTSDIRNMSPLFYRLDYATVMFSIIYSLLVSVKGLAAFCSHFMIFSLC